MTRRTRHEIVREECFSYLSRCAIRGEQGAIDTIKRMERENGRGARRKFTAEEQAECDAKNDPDIPF